MNAAEKPVELNYEDWIHNIPLMHIDTIPADLDKNQCTLACEVTGDLKPALEHLAGLAAEGPMLIETFVNKADYEKLILR